MKNIVRKISKDYERKKNEQATIPNTQTLLHIVFSLDES